MALKVFLFNDYRVFIRAKLDENADLRGYQGALAKAAGCQPSFFSQMLSSHLQLTPDHAANLCDFWKFNSSERDYFVTLVMKDRAASRELKNMCDETLERLRKANADLSKRFGKERELVAEHESVYYSSWLLSAIHIGIAIPEFQSPKILAARLGVPVELVTNGLKTLESLELAEQTTGDKWQITKKSIHLPRFSPFQKTHHLNWRFRAIHRAQEGQEKGVHYTSIYALAKNDIARIEEVIRECIEKTRKIVEPSPEEELVCFTCDLFRV